MGFIKQFNLRPFDRYIIGSHGYLKNSIPLVTSMVGRLACASVVWSSWKWSLIAVRAGVAPFQEALFSHLFPQLRSLTDGLAEPSERAGRVSICHMATWSSEAYLLEQAGSPSSAHPLPDVSAAAPALISVTSEFSETVQGRWKLPKTGSWTVAVNKQINLS